MTQAPDLQSEEFDFAPATERAGFRLHHFEVFNWGTFHERVWRVHPGGDNMLLTGDIGSGKSTLVDALTTLLVPAQKISYNKAAGADARERSLRTYVMGNYKSERGDSGMAARAVALRDHNSYSVILGVFYNEGYDQTVTLAQVFWFKDARGQPERFYVVADTRLSVAEHFAGFGTDIAQLRKRLRATAGVTLHDSFPPYGADFRRRFGIAGEQAMDLFHQTVSMKSVGNLTDFVRDHMLEAFPVEARIAALIAHFDDLNRAHEAVLKAKRQIEQLMPLTADCERHRQLQQQVEQLRGCREALRPWFAHLKGALLEKRMDALQADLDKLAHRLAQLDEERRSQALRRDEMTRAIAANGGNRIEQIKSDIARLHALKDERTTRATQYDALALAVGLPGAAEAGVFEANRRAIEDGKERCVEQRDNSQNRLTEAGVSLRELGRQHNDITIELDSLRQRRSNISSQMLRVRETLCDALHLAPDSLPFIGELIQVREDERAWEGAAERLLHNFGLSLLVPEAHYGAVAAWVDTTNLGNRLVYYRVRASVAPDQRSLHPDALARKLAIKTDSPFYGWIDAELARRFDHACCETLDQFRREKRAVTRNGQIKAGGERHEKDDRHRLDDRSGYVLGWSNDAKIAAFARQERDLATRVQAIAGKIQGLKAEVNGQNALLGTWQQLAMFSNFTDLDWKPLVASVDGLEREQQALAASSDVLRTLQHQFTELTAAQSATEVAIGKDATAHARLAEKLEQAGNALTDCATLLDATPADARERYFPLLEALRVQAM
ncbi:MAG: ATP-binding protein, partial [Telluria sp.]